MVDVFKDRKTNGANFDIVFKDEMIKKRYSKHIDHTNCQEHEPAEWAQQSQYNGIKVNSTVQYSLTTTTSLELAENFENNSCHPP